MNPSNLPRRLAIAGVLVGLVLMATWWYVDTFDPFHFPTVEEARAMPSFSPPWLYRFLQTLTWVLCPGAMALALAVHVPTAVTYLIWGAASLINAPIYYLVGLTLSAIWRRVSPT